MTENELIQNVTAMQQGDRNAFTALYYEYYQALYFYLFKLTKDKPTAEDMTQESFITSMEKIGDLKNPAAYKTWLFSIASNCAKKHFREQNRFSDFDTDEELEAAFEQAEDYSQGLLVPSDYLENKEVKQRVKQAIDSLPDMQRSAIILFYYENMRIKEIAQALGINENAVNHRLAEGRRAIAKKLSDIRSDNFVFIPLPLMLTGIGKELGLAGGIGAIGAAEAGTATAAGSAGTAVAGTAGASGAAGTAATATVTAGKVSLGMKIAAVAAAALVAGSTAFGISQMNKDDDDDDKKSRHHAVVLDDSTGLENESTDSGLTIEEDSFDENNNEEEPPFEEDEGDIENQRLLYRDIYNNLSRDTTIYFLTLDEAFKKLCEDFDIIPEQDFIPGYKLFKDCDDGTGDVWGSVYYASEYQIFGATDPYIDENGDTWFRSANKYNYGDISIIFNSLMRIDFRANYNGLTAEQLNSISTYSQLRSIPIDHCQIFNFSFFSGSIPGSYPDFSFNKTTGERIDYIQTSVLISPDNGQSYDAVKAALEYGAEYYDIYDEEEIPNSWSLGEGTTVQLADNPPEWLDTSNEDPDWSAQNPNGDKWYELRITRLDLKDSRTDHHPAPNDNILP